MTTNPQLPNHLIRELMHIIRLKRNRTGCSSGDAMVLLALSGKEPFSVFRYVVETQVVAITDWDDVSLESRQGRAEVDLKFLTEGTKSLVIRFVRELHAYDTPPRPLLFKKIIKLTIDEFDKSFTPTLNLWSDLEVLKLGFGSDPFNDFFNEVNDGNISLTKLRKLDIRLTLIDLLKIMSNSISFPLPEVVTFRFSFNVLSDLVSLQTFPKVKHLVLDIWQDIQMTATTLRHISTLISCFTSLETAEIEFFYDHYAYNNEFARVVEFHEWLRDTNFSFPVEVDVYEIAKLAYPESPKTIYEQLKSIGYKEDGKPTNFILKKEYGNVKLNHQIEHFDKYRFDDTDDEY